MHNPLFPFQNIEPRKMGQSKVRSALTVAAIALLVMVVAVGCSAQAKKERHLRRGEEYFQAGRFDDARIEYLNVLRIDSTNATGVRRMGETWFASGNPREALRYFNSAKELQPDDFSNRAKIAACLSAIGNRPEARKEALEILKWAPANDDAILVLADTTQSTPELEDTQRSIDAGKNPDRAALHLASATLLLKKGEVAAVQKELERAIELDPKSSLAHLGLASLWWSKSDLASAETEFKKAAESSPSRSVARVKYADFKAKNNAVGEARGLLNEITGRAPDYFPAWLGLARLSVEQGKYAEALAYLDNVFRRDSDYVEARLVRAIIWMAEGETAKAEQSLEALTKQHPKMYPAKFQLAQVYLRNGKVSQAALVLGDVIAANPNYVEAVLLQASINLRRGNAPEVAAAMEDLLKKQPDLMQPQMVLVEAYRSTGRLDEAAAILRREVQAKPDDASFHYLLGIVQGQKREMAGARASFERAFALAPDNSVFLGPIIELDLSAKNFDAALAKVHAEEKKSPKSAGVKFLEARVAAAQAKWNLVEAALVETLKLDPDFSDATELLIPTYIALKRYPEAIDAADHVLQKAPNNTSVLKTGALLCDKTQDFSKARDFYERYVALKPDDQPMINNLAYLYCARLNNLDRASALAHKAAALRPSDPAGEDTLGWILFRQGDYAQALALIQEAAEKLGDKPELQFHLGMVNYMMGQSEAARAALKRAQDAAADFPGKAEIAPRLALLEDDPKAQTSQRLEPLLQKFPEDPLILTRLAEACEREGQYAKAAAAYESFVRKNPKLLKPLLKLAELHAGPLNDHTKAIEYAQKAKLLAPTDAAASSTLGRLVFQIGNYSWAYSLLHEAVHLKGDDASALHDLAWASYSLGKVAEAEQAMRAVIKADSDSNEAADARSFLAMTALDQQPDQLSAHEGEVKKLLQADPKYAPAQMALAALQAQSGETKAAIEAYSALLRRFPDFAPAQKHLALLYFNDPVNRSKAGDLASKARQVLPDDADLAGLLGAINFEERKFTYAIQLLRESARKKPLDARGLYYLGRAYLESREPVKGREILEQSLQAGLADPLANEARRALAGSRPE